MATQHSKPGARLHPTLTFNPATAGTQSNDETPWQHLMVIDYLMFEVIDVLEQERAAGDHTPLNRHWQHFLHRLRQQKPRLGVWLDNWLAKPRLWLFKSLQRAHIDEPVPWIQLKGKWLAKAGFTIDTPIKVTVSKGCLILTTE